MSWNKVISLNLFPIKLYVCSLVFDTLVFEFDELDCFLKWQNRFVISVDVLRKWIASMWMPKHIHVWKQKYENCFFQLYLSTHEMGTMSLRFKHDIALIILVWTYFIELIQKGRKICFLSTTIKIYGTYIRFFKKNQTTKLNIGNIEEKGLQLRFWRIGKLRTAIKCR